MQYGVGRRTAGKERERERDRQQQQWDSGDATEPKDISIRIHSCRERDRGREHFASLRSAVHRPALFLHRLCHIGLLLWLLLTIMSHQLEIVPSHCQRRPNVKRDMCVLASSCSVLLFLLIIAFLYIYIFLFCIFSVYTLGGNERKFVVVPIAATATAAAGCIGMSARTKSTHANDGRLECGSDWKTKTKNEKRSDTQL